MPGFATSRGRPFAVDATTFARGNGYTRGQGSPSDSADSATSDSRNAGPFFEGQVREKVYIARRIRCPNVIGQSRSNVFISQYLIFLLEKFCFYFIYSGEHAKR